MALDVLVQGKLVKAPEQRESKNGNPYVLAQASVATEGEDSVLASLIAFRESARDALLVLDAGDGICVAGRAKVTTWTSRDGEAKAGLSIVADQVLTAYHVRRKRQAVQDDGGDVDDRTPAPATDRSATARDSSRSGTSARSARPLQATLPVETRGIADMDEDLPFQAAATGGMR